MEKIELDSSQTCITKKSGTTGKLQEEQFQSSVRNFTAKMMRQLSGGLESRAYLVDF